MLTNMFTPYDNYHEPIRGLVAVGNNLIAYVPHLDVNTWRIRLLYSLQDESGVELFRRLLAYLDTLPPIEVPPPSSASFQKCNIRYHHNFEPKTMLQQCLCQAPSNCFSPNLADPESLLCLDGLFGLMQSKSKSRAVNSLSGSNPDLNGQADLKSYLSNLSDQKIEQSLLKCLADFFPRHPAYLLLQAPTQMDVSYKESSTFLSFGEEVRSYYKALELFRPTLDYCVPGFYEYSTKAHGNCHLALRRGGQLQSVMWAQISGSSLNIRLIFKLMTGSVLEQMMANARAYAFLRSLSSVAAFVNVKQLNRCVGRYIDLGFMPTFRFMHNFSF